MTLKPAHDPSCVLAYPFEEASDNTVYDQSQYGRNGTISGATRVQGKLGKGMYFDGVDDYVRSSAFTLTGTAISIMAWVNCQIQSSFQMVFNKSTQSPTQGFLMLYREFNTDKLCYQYATGSTYVAKDAVNFFTGFNNQYLFVAVTCDYQNKILKFYRNGQIHTTYSITDPMLFPSASSACYICSYQGSMHFFKGVIDEVRLYNRLLTDQEILKHYRYGISQRARIRLPMFERVKRRQARQVT